MGCEISPVNYIILNHCTIEWAVYYSNYIPSLEVTFHTAWITPTVPPNLRTVSVTVSGVLPSGSAISLVPLPGANSAQSGREGEREEER